MAKAEEWQVLSVENQPADLVGFLSEQEACFLSRGARLFMYWRFTRSTKPPECVLSSPSDYGRGVGPQSGAARSRNTPVVRRLVGCCERQSRRFLPRRRWISSRSCRRHRGSRASAARGNGGNSQQTQTSEMVPNLTSDGVRPQGLAVTRLFRALDRRPSGFGARRPAQRSGPQS